MQIPELNRIRFTDNAKSDLSEIWHFISLDSDFYADKTINEIISTARLIGKNREIGARRDDLQIDLRLFPFKHYNIFYFIVGDGVVISRVLHSSRDAEAILDDDTIDLTEENI